MKIKMKTAMAGPDGTASPGDIIDVPKSQAYDFIEGGYAEQVVEEHFDTKGADVDAADRLSAAADPVELEAATAAPVEVAADVAPPRKVAAPRKVAIPSNWKGLNAAAAKALAAKLGNPNAKNKAAAMATIGEAANA